MFERILTLALNPSLDTTIWVDNLQLGGVHKAEDEMYDAAGKTVNVSRVLTYYGVSNQLILLLGEGNKRRFLERLNEGKVDYLPILVEGYTRENLSFVDDHGRMTRVMRKGFHVAYEDFVQVTQAVEERVDDKTLVMISGSLPTGITPRMLRTFCERVKKKGGTISLDCVDLSREDVTTIAPWVIKPNLEEFQALIGQEVTSRDQLVDQASRLVEDGVGCCLVSLGAEGLLCVDKDHVLLAHVPAVEVHSAVGAGDSLLAGFVRSVKSGLDLKKSVATAAAFGMAACMTEGTSPPHKLTVAHVLQQVELQELPRQPLEENK